MQYFTGSLQRELMHLRNDKGDLFLTVAMLPLLCAFIWWIFSAGQPDSLPVAIIDQDQTATSREFIRLTNAAPGIELQHGFNSQSAAVDALRKRGVYAVLLVPAQFERDIYTGSPAEVVLMLNSQYSTYASTIERHVSGAALTAGVGIGANRLQMLGMFGEQSLTMAMPISVIATPLFNEGPNYEVFLAATLIPALFQILAMILAVSAVGRELRDGTALDWLHTSGGSLALALGAKLLPPILVINGYAAIIVWFFQHVAPDSYSGNGLSIWLSFVLMNITAMAVGILILAVTRNFRMGLSLAGFYSAPAFAYSGQAFPLISMPDAAQYWASILPLTHWLKIYNQLWMAGAPITEVMDSVKVLAAMLTVAGLFGYLLLKHYAFKPESWGAR
ncbi:MAG: ABC transporter permease [Oceanicaulis sp.]|nr:ABC transporter permease [Oceanicaulis sp.]